MTALRKAALRFRAAAHIDLMAAMLGCCPSELFVIWPKMPLSIARKAIRDIQAAERGEYPMDGLTDAERMQHARLYQTGWAYPISQEGNRRAEQARLERERIRERGMDRVRAREAARWRAAEAAE
jgi:hypothetical protein